MVHAPPPFRLRTCSPSPGRFLARPSVLIIGLCGLVLAGLLLFGPLGDALLSRAVSSFFSQALAPYGMSLRFEATHGPLPGRVRLEHIRIADRDGLWFACQSVDLQLRLSSLFFGQIVVDPLDIREPIVFRLPQLAQPAQPELLGQRDALASTFAKSSAAPQPSTTAVFDGAAAEANAPQQLSTAIGDGAASEADVFVFPSWISLDVESIKAINVQFAPDVFGVSTNKLPLYCNVSGSLNIHDTAMSLVVSSSWGRTLLSELATDATLLSLTAAYADGHVIVHLGGDGAVLATPLLARFAPNLLAPKRLRLDIAADAAITSLSPSPSRPLVIAANGSFLYMTEDSSQGGTAHTVARGTLRWEGEGGTADARIGVRAGSGGLLLDPMFDAELDVIFLPEQCETDLAVDVPDIRRATKALVSFRTRDDFTAHMDELAPWLPNGRMRLLQRATQLYASYQPELGSVKLFLTQLDWPWRAAGRLLGPELTVVSRIKRERGAAGDIWHASDVRMTGRNLWLEGALRLNVPHRPHAAEQGSGVQSLAAHTVGANHEGDELTELSGLLAFEAPNNVLLFATQLQDRDELAVLKVQGQARGSIGLRVPGVFGIMHGALAGTSSAQLHLRADSPELSISLGELPPQLARNMQLDARFELDSDLLNGSFTAELQAEALRGVPFFLQVTRQGAPQDAIPRLMMDMLRLQP